MKAENIVKKPKEKIERMLVLFHWAECTETGTEIAYALWKKQLGKKGIEKLIELNKGIL